MPTTSVPTSRGSANQASYRGIKIAAATSKSGTLQAFIGSFPIPLVVAGINSFMLGAQSVNPNVKLKIVWTNSWFDPGKEADAAKALIDQGADVLLLWCPSSPAVTQVAEERGVFSLPESSDMSKFGPHAQLTAEIYQWGDYYTRRTKDVLNGTWKSTDTWGGFNSGMLAMAPYANMSDGVKKMAMDSEAAIKSGQLRRLNVRVLDQGRQGRRVQGRRSLGRHSDPHHELVRQGRGREGAQQVIA